jgi:predicted nucleotidyltransferase
MPSPSVSHKLFHRERIPIDLIPFGGVEDAAGRIIWSADESLIGVLGYREAQATGVEVLLPGGQGIRTVSLPMLAILKVIVWAERHTTQPRKDASDLLLVLGNYLSDKAAEERLYNEAPHLLEAEDFDYQVAGAWLAGRDSAEAITLTSAEPERLLNAVRDILVSEVNPDGPLRLVGESGSPQTALRLLKGFLDGLSASR